MPPVRAPLRLSLVWGRAEGKAIHSKQLANTGTVLMSPFGGVQGDVSPRTDTNRRRLNAKNTAVAFQVGSFRVAENVPGHKTLA